VASGAIHEDMDPADAYTLCLHNAAEDFEHYDYEVRFPERLAAVIEEVERDMDRAAEEKAALLKDRSKYPINATNHRGEPRWEGSVAQELLRKDIDEGKNEQMRPRDLWLSRPEYQEYDKEVFRKHIHQEVSSRKYNQFCADRSEKKYAEAAEKARIAKEKRNNKHTVAELKEMCRKNHLATSGTKADLLERLEEHQERLELEEKSIRFKN